MNKTESNYAGFPIRFAARVIDFFVTLLLLGVASTVVTSIVLFVTTDANAWLMWLVFGSWLLGFFVIHGYFIVLHALYGQTVGKKVLKIKVIRIEGKSVGWAAAILREIGEFVATLPLFLGYIWIVFDSKKQGWHDKIANTYVVKVEK